MKFIKDVIYWFKLLFVIRHKQTKKEKIIKKLLSTDEGRQKLFEAMAVDKIKPLPSPSDRLLKEDEISKRKK